MLNNEELDRLETHWAVSAISKKTRKHCFDTIRKKQVYEALQQSIAFPDLIEEGFENELSKLALAYEIPAIENIANYTNYADESCDRNLFMAASWRCSDLYTSMDIPKEFNKKVFQVLRICSMAYCGDRWNDLKKWYLHNKELLWEESMDHSNDNWGDKLLKTVYRCWLRLFVKKDWEDLSKIAGEIIAIRQLQDKYERNYLDQTNDSRYGALILISFYHLAKATELLSSYMMQGDPVAIHSQLDKHFESAIESAEYSEDIELETILRWLSCASHQMVDNSIWWIAKAINSRTTEFVKYVTQNRGLFEMLPPQKAAIREQGLLDPAVTSIAVEMPTSGGKTLLAEFKMLQALNQFSQEKGWVAYIAPTKALTAQITRRLRKDFGDKIKVEQLSAAVEIDSYESELLKNDERAFDILVSTPEKMNLVIKNSDISRPLALMVMDEAHNIEDTQRGLRIELLLATVKTDCPTTNFLLLMPYVENAQTLSRWLSGDGISGKSISIGNTPWKPSERVVGIYEKCKGKQRGDWYLEYESLLTMSDTVNFSGKYKVNGHRHFGKAYSATNKTDMTAAMAKELSLRGTCLAIGRTTNASWNMARVLCEDMEKLHGKADGYENIQLVQKYLADEMGRDFELINMLEKGIGVHNAGLPDDVKNLMEWLAEEGDLKILCATTTVAQGINFPVSSVLLQSISMPNGKYSKDMTPREFWNLAGRAGRIGQNSLGLVGIACEDKKREIMRFVSEKTGALVSRLVTLVNSVDEAGQIYNLKKIMYRDEWTDFRCYIAHLCNEKERLDDIISEMEQLLRNTLGYNAIKASNNGTIKAKQLLDATKEYATDLLKQPQISKLADETGFSPEGIKKAFSAINDLDKKLTAESFKTKKIFGEPNVLADMYGVMLKIPQLQQLEEIAGSGKKHENIANITMDWVSGSSIYDIAIKYFSDKDSTTDKLTLASKAINKQIANCGTWGLSAITKLSGINFEQLSDEQRKEIDALPAMIYHGVRTPEAVLMRINNVPRSISENLGCEYKKIASEYSVQEANEFVRSLSENDWERVRKPNSAMNGKDYMNIWKLFSGL